MRGSKHMVRANDGRTVGEALELMALWNSAYIHSADLTEAMAANGLAHFTKVGDDFQSYVDGVVEEIRTLSQEIGVIQ